MRIINEETVGLVIDIQERLVPAMKKKDKVYKNTLHLIEAAKQSWAEGDWH